MSFFDLLKLFHRYWKLLVSLPIICAMVCAIILIMLPPTFQAKATLLSNGDIALAGGFVQSEAIHFSQNGIEVTSSVDAPNMTISAVAKGKDYGGCIAAVNATVDAAGASLRETDNQLVVEVNEAVNAEAVSLNILTSVLTALFAGFFAAVCLVLLFDAVKAPIKSRRDAEESSNLPVLGIIPNRDRGEKLLANIRFLANDEAISIAIVPVGASGSVLTCAELVNAFNSNGIAVTHMKANPHVQSVNTDAIPSGTFSLIECSPLSDGMGAAYIARDCDITILCVCEWIDTRKKLVSVIDELRFAKANLGGIVLIDKSRVK